MSMNISETQKKNELINVINEHMNSDWIFSRETQILLIIIYSSFVFFGAISNITVVYVTLRQKSLWNPHTLLLLNLFVSNIATAFICMPFTLISLLRRSWTMGKVLCKLVPFLQGVTVFVSAGTVTATSIDRCFRVLGNRPTLSHYSAGRLSIIYSLLIWLIAGVLSAPIFVFKQMVTVGIEDVFSYPVCLEVWPHHIRFQYTLITFIVAFIVPVFFLVVCHLQVKRYLNNHLKRMEPIRPTSSDEENVRSRNASNTGVSKESLPLHCKEVRRNSRVTFTMITGAVSYTISWLPWNVYNLYLDYYSAEITLTLKEMYFIFSVCHIIAMSSTITNVIIYGFMNTNINREIKVLKDECYSFLCLPFFKRSTETNPTEI